MIVTCPACHTRYLIDDQELGETQGRTVRCAKCGHTWQQRKPPEPRPVLNVEASPLEPSLEMPPRPNGERPLPLPRRRSWAGVVWLALLSLLGAAILAVVFARQEVVALWPPAARFYTLAGLAAAKPGANLAFRNVAPARQGDGLIVAGEIVNTGQNAEQVPQLEVILRDAKKKPVLSKRVAPPKSRLLPGEVEHFSASFAHSPDAAIDVAVRFAPP